MENIDAIDYHSDGEPLEKKIKVDRDSNINEIVDSYKQLDVYFLSKQLQSPYYGYKLYFDEDNELNKELIEKIEASIKFLRKNSDIYTKDSSTETNLFSVSVRRFYDDAVFMSKWKIFKKDLKNFPENTLNCLGLALYHCVAQEKFKDDTIISMCLQKLQLKIFDYESNEPTNDLQELCGKLLEIRGQVINIKRPTYQIEWLLFLCTRCFRLETVKQVNGVYTSPKRCQKCGKRKFKAQKDSLYTKSIALQNIELQYSALMEDDHGQILKILDVKLLGDLVNTCSLHDNVTVVGILKTYLKKSKKDIFAAELLYLEAVSLISVPQPKTTVIIELNEDDISIINKIRSESDIFSSLVRSFCPEIYGHDMIKAGLLLSLFSGSESEEVKDNINVLLFGDTGVGKSVLMRTYAQVAPKSVFVNMTRSTLLGFNVKSAKKKQKEPVLESGALVLANGGSCVIDGFRKPSAKQSQDLFEAMEADQNLYVQKLGVNCSIAVKTSIVAAARPPEGKYNYKKTFEKNLDIHKEILSRFDLIFLMLDHSDTKFKALKATHILNSHVSAVTNAIEIKTDEEKIGSQELISKITLQKYIAYARQINAQLSEASAKIIENYFIELKQNNYFNELLCHNRHFESLIRLTQARAKSELREEATEHDAEEVIKIHQFAIDTLKKVILASRSQSRYKKAASEDIRLYFKKIINPDDSQKEQ